MQKIFILLIFIFPLFSFGHSGRTNDNGCHNDNKNGGYHCHRSSNNISSARSISSDQQISKTVYFNTDSYKYHDHSCRWARACTVNCVLMPLIEAQKRGGVACKVCGG